MGEVENGLFKLSLFSSWNLSFGDNLMHVSSREQRLIAALAIQGDRPRSYLVGLLWPESPEHRALANLRVSVHIIRRHIPGLLVDHGPVLALTHSVIIDLHQLKEQIQSIVAGQLANLSPNCVDNLRRAELLPGWYDDWVLFEQARLSHVRLRALQIIARSFLAAHDYEIALEAAEAALEIEPLYESAVELLIVAERAQGNDLCALRSYKNYEAHLRENLGVKPSAAIRRIVSDLL